MSHWRLLKLTTHDAFMNMAIDEAILTARISDVVPDTLRFYQWRPSAVSIGKFQNLEKEVQLENCKNLGVDVVRRISGGGTVYHDSEKEVTYGVIAQKEGLGAKDIADVYGRIYAGLAAALETLGINADFNEGDAKTCPNLTVDGKKISGSAQCHKAGVVLQHGTVLVEVDLERMFSVIRVPWAKTCMEVVNVAKLKITSITEELGREITPTEIENALTKGFQSTLDGKLENDKLTSYESQLAEKLFAKYSSHKWTFNGKNAS